MEFLLFLFNCSVNLFDRFRFQRTRKQGSCPWSLITKHNSRNKDPPRWDFHPKNSLWVTLTNLFPLFFSGCATLKQVHESRCCHHLGCVMVLSTPQMEKEIFSLFTQLWPTGRHDPLTCHVGPPPHWLEILSDQRADSATSTLISSLVYLKLNFSCLLWCCSQPSGKFVCVLQDMYMSLSRAGFKHQQIEQAMTSTVQYGGDLIDALDWLCLNLNNGMEFSSLCTRHVPPQADQNFQKVNQQISLFAVQ